MAFDDLLSKADALVRGMVENGYCADYVCKVSSEINWLRKNGGEYDSLESAYRARASRPSQDGSRRASA